MFSSNNFLATVKYKFSPHRHGDEKGWKIKFKNAEISVEPIVFGVTEMNSDNPEAFGLLLVYSEKSGLES